ncbi:MAG: MFS transporter [Byssovorax sp.]
MNASPPSTLRTDEALILPRAQRWLVTLAILFALVVAAFEGTGVSGAMPTIAAELGGLGAYAWVFSAFLSASTLGVLTCGKLADTFGRRPVFTAGVGLFLAASALCGAARSIEALIVFRALQGFGAGAIQPIAMTISADIYPLKERARIQGLYTAVWGSANVLGPLLGGALILRLSWRWVFFVNLPVGLVAMALVLAAYRDPPRGERGPSGVGGAALAGVTAAVTLLALEPAGSMGGAARALFALLAVALCVALDRQQRRSPAPLLTMTLARNRVVQAALCAGLFSGGLLYAATAYVPLWMSRQMGRDPLSAGASLIPLLVGWSVGSTVGVRVLVRWGMRASVAGGFAIAFAGATFLAAVVLLGLPAPLAYAALGLMGLGVGPAASGALIAAQTEAGWNERGMVTSVVYGARMLGGALMVAALGGKEGASSAANAASGPPAMRFIGIALGALAAMVLLGTLSPAGRLRASLAGEPPADPGG